jgi:phosphoribosyl-ATP pyrophosphohydrolase/phosphoribosyl-AMP cyclohydrolase
METLKFDAQGLIPCVTIDYETKQPLMLAYMNRESLSLTLETGEATYFSRSRQKLWKKGETSGNTQRVMDLRTDCDGDALLMAVEQSGVACHTGVRSCFYQDGEIFGSEPFVIPQLMETIRNRKKEPVEGSYTNYLFDKGLDKILKKVGEETAEVIIAAKNSSEELIYETADLMYHLLVLYESQNINFNAVLNELKKRSR